MSVELIGREDIHNELILCERSAKNCDKKICFIPNILAREYAAIIKLPSDAYTAEMTRLTNIQAIDEEDINIRFYFKFKEQILNDLQPGKYVTVPDFISHAKNANKRCFYTYDDFSRICSPAAARHNSNNYVYDTVTKTLIKIPNYVPTFPEWILKNRKECAIEGRVLRKYLESIGFRFYYGSFPSKVYYEYLAILPIPELYYEYSEYDLINMDWSDFDKKILPLLDHVYEYNFCAKIEGNKIIVSYINTGHLGYTWINYYDPINGHTHPAGRSEVHHTEDPSEADMNACLSSTIKKKIALHFICTKQGVYILSVSKSLIKSGKVPDRVTKRADTRNCKTIGEAVSRIKCFCNKVGIMVMYRPIIKLTNPINNNGQKKYTIAEYNKITNSTTKLTPQLLLNADLSEIKKLMPEPGFYNYFGAYYNNKKIEIDHTFSSHSHEESFNSRRIRDQDISNKIVVAIMNDKDFPQLLSFDALRSVFASGAPEWLFIVGQTMFKLIGCKGADKNEFIDYSTPPTMR